MFHGPHPHCYRVRNGNALWNMSDKIHTLEASLLSDGVEDRFWQHIPGLDEIVSTGSLLAHAATSVERVSNDHRISFQAEGVDQWPGDGQTRRQHQARLYLFACIEHPGNPGHISHRCYSTRQIE